jgi:hypothetical protein
VLVPVINLKPDNLNEKNREFTQTDLRKPVFLNSVPKCGTHLIRNIVRMFVPVEQQYDEVFIQHTTLKNHLKAFDLSSPHVSWGHLLFSADAAIALQQVNHLLLIRDPYDWVPARARFFLSEQFLGNLDEIKGGAITAEEVLNMMIMGVHAKAPSLLSVFMFNAVSWYGTRARFVRYEDLIKNLKGLDGPEAEAFFASLLGDCGIDPIPEDWRERVRIGSDRRQSSTARENLTLPTSVEIPAVLPPAQKALVDYAAPGLRKLLGYE